MILSYGLFSVVVGIAIYWGGPYFLSISFLASGVIVNIFEALAKCALHLGYEDYNFSEAIPVHF